jgi:hypothetical protein
MCEPLLRVAADDEGEGVFGLDVCTDEPVSLPPVREGESGKVNAFVVITIIEAISAAGTVTILTAAPPGSAVLVFIQRHVGVYVGM